MHIPDNYLSPSTCAVMAGIMIPVWKKSISKVKHELEKSKMPLIGVGAAFSFLIMMFNVPLPGGTTGHAVGASLIAILLGPYAATLSITTALIIQALFFGDGGVLALGANSFNMAFIMPFTAYFIYKIIKDNFKSTKGEYLGILIGSYTSICIASFFAAIEFGIQPLLFKDASGMPLYCPYPLSVSIPAMLVPHMLVAGIVETIVSIGVFTFIKKTSPGIIYKGKKINFKPIYGLILCAILLSPLGLLASGTAWGEWGTEEIKNLTLNGNILGFTPLGMKKGFSFNAIMPDYSISGLPDFIGYVISAIAGVAIITIIFKIINSNKKIQN